VVNAGVLQEHDLWQSQTVKRDTHIGFILIHHMQSAGFSNPKHNLTCNRVPAATLNARSPQGRPTNIPELDQNNTGAEPGHKRTLLTSWAQVETASLWCGWQHASKRALVLFFLQQGVRVTTWSRCWCQLKLWSLITKSTYGSTVLWLCSPIACMPSSPWGEVSSEQVTSGRSKCIIEFE